MKYSLLIILTFVVSFTTLGQSDSIKTTVPTTFHGMRLGAGFEKSLFVEVGYSYLDMSMDMVQSASMLLAN